jgi:predicted DNA binding CopG/RHH family protein
MTEKDRRDALLERDWGDEWNILPEAPALVLVQPKTAQITLRVPAHVVAALKLVAAAKSLPYHALARSWILGALRSGELPDPAIELEDEESTASEQLNIKLEPEVLVQLKKFSHAARRPYHRLARQWIETALARERASVARPESSSQRPSMREIMILLLHGHENRLGTDAIRGMTRLQKLLFVIQQHIEPQSTTFYPFHYGPFDDQVIDSAHALRDRGFLTGGEPSVGADRPSFADMMATVMHRAGPPESEPETFELTPAGHEAAERLRRADDAYNTLYVRIQTLRQQWDTPNVQDLVARVYERWPDYAERSRIKDEIAQRRARRRAGGR